MALWDSCARPGAALGVFCPAHPGLSAQSRGCHRGHSLSCLSFWANKATQKGRQVWTSQPEASPVNPGAEATLCGPPCVGPSLPSIQLWGLGSPGEHLFFSTKPHESLPFWPEVLGYKMFPVDRDEDCSRGKEKLLPKTSFTPSALCSPLLTWHA